MSTRTYFCTQCGTLRRASAVYFLHKETAEQAKASARWPKHCSKPMKPLSYEQGVAANKIEQQKRVGWAEKGLHILQRGGKRKWVPALSLREIEEAKQQYLTFLSDRRAGSRTQDN